MKAVSRKTLAAALTLGAAVSAWPVQALQCLEPVGIERDQPIDDALARMSSKAATVVASAKSIFKGRIVSARSLTSESPFEARLLVTYKVSEWKRGSDQPLAKIIYFPWCDGECATKEIIKDLLSQKEERFYLALPGKERFGKKAIDGYMGPCHMMLSKRPINAGITDLHYNQYFGQFLYDLTIAAELERLPSKKP